MGETGFILVREPEPKDGDCIKAKLKDSSEFVHKKFGDIIDRNVFDVALEYIQQLESAQPKWISVEERYPADDQCVMYVDDGEVAFRIVRGWALRELCEFPEHREVHRVTHWMPLPEAPKEEA